MHRPIIASVSQVEVLELSPPARFGELETLSHQLRPVRNGRSQVAHVYEVEFLLKRPGLFGIINFEFYVRRNPASLARVVLVVIVVSTMKAAWGSDQSL